MDSPRSTTPPRSVSVVTTAYALAYLLIIAATVSPWCVGAVVLVSGPLVGRAWVRR